MRPYRLTGRLDGHSALLLTSPHSGTHLPAAFLDQTRLPVLALRQLEDAHVGDLLESAAALGVPLLEASYSRAVIDLNRAEDELDAAMFDGRFARPLRPTGRVARGHGLIPRVAGENQPIYGAKLPVSEVERRIATVHRPWHLAISAALDAARVRHGCALLLDCHSMPTLQTASPPQLVLGDRHGRSAAPAVVDWLEQRFVASGLRVARNAPYAGGHVTERHGRPERAIHCIQLEFDRALYMNPQTLVRHAGFARLQAMIAGVCRQLVRDLPCLIGPTDQALAAE